MVLCILFLEPERGNLSLLVHLICSFSQRWLSQLLEAVELFDCHNAHDLKSCSVCLFEIVLSGQDSVNFKDLLSCYSTEYIWKANGGSVFDPDNNTNKLFTSILTMCQGVQQKLSIFSFNNHEKICNVFLLWSYYNFLKKWGLENLKKLLII